eukprot:g4503.t1
METFYKKRKKERNLASEASSHIPSQWIPENILKREKIYDISRCSSAKDECREKVIRDEMGDLVKSRTGLCTKFREMFKSRGTVMKTSTNTYKVAKLIGFGSYSKVYKVSRDGMVYACKMIAKKCVLRARNGDVQKSIVALRNEVYLGSKLRHPNIVRLIDVFETRACVALVMEYMAGQDLHRYITSRHSVRENEVAHIAWQITSALRFLHSIGIVHRDIKPENIMLTNPSSSNTEMPTAKLIDFGLSRFLKSDTHASSFVGTSHYAAPEILMSKEYDFKVDMWSLGVLCFVLLSGKFPFTNFLDPVRKGNRASPQIKTPEWSSITSEAKAFVVCLLSFEPAMRPSSKDAADSPWFARWGVGPRPGSSVSRGGA